MAEVIVFISVVAFAELLSQVLLEKTPTTAEMIVFISVVAFAELLSQVLLEKTPTTAEKPTTRDPENSNNGGSVETSHGA